MIVLFGHAQPHVVQKHTPKKKQKLIITLLALLGTLLEFRQQVHIACVFPAKWATKPSYTHMLYTLVAKKKNQRQKGAGYIQDMWCEIVWRQMNTEGKKCVDEYNPSIEAKR